MNAHDPQEPTCRGRLVTGHVTMTTRPTSRLYLFKTVSIALGLLVPLLAAELVMRFLPFHTGLHSVPVNDMNPVYHFTNNQRFTYSRDWDFKNIHHRRTNNFGFVSDIDYDPGASSPLLVMIGDSYIEAAQNDFEETAQARLGARVGTGGRVYALGAGFAPLSQYLAWAEFARNTFHPDAVVVNVVGNDFDQSLLSVQQSLARKVFGGMHYFVKDADAGLRLVRVDLEKDPLQEFLKRSALAQYLVRNVGIQSVVPNMVQSWQIFRNKGDVPAFVGNVPSAADENHVQASKQVVDTFLNVLPEKSGLPPSRILLTVDGLRPELYDEKELAKVQSSYFAVMRRYLVETAQQRGFEVIDLQPLFTERFKRTNERAERIFDYHWNGVGHEVMAEAVATSNVFATTFARDERM